MPNVGVLLVGTQVAGAEKQFMRTARALQERHGRVWLLINAELAEGARSHAECAEILEVLRARDRLLEIPAFPERAGHRLAKAWRAFHAWRLARSRGIEVLHAVMFGVGAAQLALEAGIRVVAEVSSPDFVDALLPHNALKRRMMRRVQAFHCVSPSVYRKLQRRFPEAGLAPEVERAVEAPVPFFLPAGEAGDGPRERLVVFASRFVERKNPVLFARAAVRFLAEHPDWKVAVLGFGPLEDEVRTILAGEIADGRAVVEYTRDLYGYLRRSQVYVSVIFPDNYPSQSLLEAMHVGNAVVATDVGDTRRFVGPENGVLVGYDEEEVARALARLAADPAGTAAMGRASREKVRRDFAPSVHVDHLLRTYERVAAGADPRPAAPAPSGSP